MKKIPVEREQQYMSLRQFGMMLDMSLGVLYSHQAAGLPIHEKGGRGVASKIHVPTVFKWMVEREAARRIDSYAKEIEVARSDKARLIKAQADQRELVVAKMNAELVSKDEITNVLLKVFAILRQSVMELPGRKAAEFAHMSSAAAIRQDQYAECVRIMSLCYDAMSEYCDELEINESGEQSS